MRGRPFLYGFFVGWLCLCFESVLLKIKTDLWRINIVFCIHLRFLNKLWNNHLSTENAYIFRKRCIFWDRDRAWSSPMYSLYVYCPTLRPTTNSHHSKHSVTYYYNLQHFFKLAPLWIIYSVLGATVSQRT